MVGRLLRVLGLVLTISMVVVPVALAQGGDVPPPGDAWRFVDVTVSPDNLTVGQIAVVRFGVVDSGGVPVSGLRVTADLRAPAASYGDSPDPILTTVGRPDGGVGRYVVTVALNQPGRWWIEAQVTDASGRSLQENEFITVAAALGVPPATTDTPLFLPGDAWGAFYRLDPSTGSLATLSGQEVLQAGDRWWVAETRLDPRGTISADYGGIWNLSVVLNDGLTGKTVHTIDLGDIRASVYVGSSDQPAIATSLAMAPDGSKLYLYWARQLGQGWMAWVAAVSMANGQLVQQRALVGAVQASVFWGQLQVAQGGAELVLAEQAVRSATVSGYRLTVLRADTLAPVAMHRRITASSDPLTNCVLAYPGPTGMVSGDAPTRYSLCSPTGQPAQLALVTWDPVAAKVIYQISLAALASGGSSSVDGVAAPDNKRFFAVNTTTRRIAEVDMLTGTVVREASYAPVPAATPSPWDRIFNWIFGMVSPRAVAGILLDPGVSIAPDGKALYLVATKGAPSSASADGVLVIDTSSLQVIGHLLAGQPVAGVAVSPGGQLVVRQVADASSDEISIIQPDGQMLVSLSLPGRLGKASETR